MVRLSIVITAFKEPKTIGKAIQSFIEQDIGVSYELIGVAPDEETSDIIKEYGRKYKQIKYLKDPGKGKPHALNLVLKKVKGEIIILTDGDVHVQDGTVEKLVKHFEDEKVGAVSGHPVPISPRNKKFGYWAHLLTAMIHNKRLKATKQGKFISCSGYLYAIRGGLVKEIPWDTLSDDAWISHLIFNQGYKTKYEPGAEVYIKYPDNFKDWITQKRRSAGGYNQIKYKFKEKNVDRSFTKEAVGIGKVLRFPNNLKEMFWTIELIFARIYLWAKIFKSINFEEKKFEDVWVRIESTK